MKLIYFYSFSFHFENIFLFSFCFPLDLVISIAPGDWQLQNELQRSKGLDWSKMKKLELQYRWKVNLSLISAQPINADAVTVTWCRTLAVVSFTSNSSFAKLRKERLNGNHIRFSRIPFHLQRCIPNIRRETEEFLRRKHPRITTQCIITWKNVMSRHM